MNKHNNRVEIKIDGEWKEVKYLEDNDNWFLMEESFSEIEAVRLIKPTEDECKPDCPSCMIDKADWQPIGDEECNHDDYEEILRARGKGSYKKCNKCGADVEFEPDLEECKDCYSRPGAGGGSGNDICRKCAERIHKSEECKPKIELIDTEKEGFWGSIKALESALNQVINHTNSK